jgi:biotin carboxylase
MREAWGRHGIEQPRFAVITSLNEALSAAETLGFPLILKPRSLWGARGVRRVTSHTELARLYEETAVLSPNALILEQCIEGVETSVEGVVIDGITHVLAVGDKELRSHRNNRVTRSINYPGAFKEYRLSAINLCAANCIRALGLDNSLFHLELFVTDNAILPIECGARGGGGHIASHIVKLVSGVDMISVAVDLLLGNKPTLASRTTQRGACYRFLFPPEGILLALPTEVSGLLDSRIVSLIYAVKPGDVIREPHHGGLRSGYLLTQGNNREAAIDVANEVEQKLQWTVV